MSNQEFSNAPMMPDDAGAPFYRTWIKALTQPNENTYATIAASPNAKAKTAYLWVFLSTLLSSFLSLLLQQSVIGSRLSELGLDSGAAGNGIAAIAVRVICGAPIAAVIGTIFFALFAALVQWIARLFGGKGTNDQLSYVYAAISVPYTVIAMVFGLLSLIPYVGFCFSIALLLVFLYILVLLVIAAKGVNEFGWGPAVGSVAVPIIAIVTVCGCLVAGLLAVAGTALTEVFNQLNQSQHNVP